MGRNIYIYILISPVCGSILYVGRTKNPKQRLSAHITEATVKESPYPIYKAIRGYICVHNRKPLLTVIEVCDGSKGCERELHWIKYFEEQGVTLLNVLSARAKYEKDFPSEIKPKIKKSRAQPLVLSVNGYLYKVFPNLRDAASYTGETIHAIRRNLLGKSESTRSGVWSKLVK